MIFLAQRENRSQASRVEDCITVPGDNRRFDSGAVGARSFNNRVKFRGRFPVQFWMQLVRMQRLRGDVLRGRAAFAIQRFL
jgi:hypothetical protein